MQEARHVSAAGAQSGPVELAAGEVAAAMRFWALAGVRYPWVRMTDHNEAVAVWLPPGEPEMTAEEEATFGPLLTAVLGPRADEVHALFDCFGEHPTDEPHYYLSLWATHHDHAGRGLGTALIHDNLTHIDA
jgi:hypothetical protein